MEVDQSIVMHTPIAPLTGGQVISKPKDSATNHCHASRSVTGDVQEHLATALNVRQCFLDR